MTKEHGFREESHQMTKSNQIKAWVWGSTLASALLTAIGHRLAHDELGWFDILCLTLRTALIELEVEETNANWLLLTMRFMLPGLLAFSVLWSVFATVRRWALLLWLHWQAPEVVFFGTGRTAKKPGAALFVLQTLRGDRSRHRA